MITPPPDTGHVSDKWDARFIDLARHISGWSKDPSTKVGCVVVGEDREITVSYTHLTLPTKA